MTVQKIAIVFCAERCDESGEKYIGEKKKKTSKFGEQICSSQESTPLMSHILKIKYQVFFNV